MRALRAWIGLFVWLGAAAAASAQAADPPIRFTFTYPARLASHPALLASLKRDEARLRRTATAEAVAGKRAAAESGFPFHRYETVQTWKLVTETPRFLSLSNQIYDFTGGAHGNSGHASLLWDKVARKRLGTLSPFDTGALRAAVTPAFCRQLDAERRRKRGGTLESGLAEFSRCIDPVAQTVILGSSTRTRFNRIGFLIGPYEAGPYAEGSYEVTLPVTPAIMATVKPAWRRFFSVMR